LIGCVLPIRLFKPRTVLQAQVLGEGHDLPLKAVEALFPLMELPRQPRHLASQHLSGW
jgi:hypothetical protein